MQADGQPRRPRRSSIRRRAHDSQPHDVGDYDRCYQNFVPGAVTADQTQVALTAYNNATERTNLFNQTDLTYVASTGAHPPHAARRRRGRTPAHRQFPQHGILQQHGDVDLVPFAAPTITTPVTFRQSATDADNHLTTKLAAAYAQDQVELSRTCRSSAACASTASTCTYHNNRNGDTLGRIDNLVSPRAGVVVKPIAPLSLYGSYSVSYLPSSGDQFSSLTTITAAGEAREVQQLRGRREVGRRAGICR